MATRRPNGTGSVYKEGKTWTAAWSNTITGEHFRKRGFATKKDAVLYIEASRSLRVHTSVSYLWSTYESTKFKKLSSEKQRHYRAVYNDRLKPIHSKRIEELTIHDLQSLVDQYESYYAQKDIKTVLSHLYNVAIPEGIVQVNLSSYIELHDHHEQKGQAWTVDEVNAFWNGWYSGDRFCGYILVMCYTGAMPVEIRTITRQMIDYDSKLITGAGAKTELRKTSPLVISDKIEPVLRELMQGSMVLWPHSKQKFYDEYYRCINRCRVRELPPYTCRHTTATLLVDKASPFVVQKVMRHAQIQTTQRYAHPGSDDMLEAVNKI